MAVVVDKNDVEKFQKLASSENIESTIVAIVTEEPRIKMYWKGKTIVDLSREFLNTNGSTKIANAKIEAPNRPCRILCSQTRKKGTDPIFLI